MASIKPGTGAMRIFRVPHVNVMVNPPGSNPPESPTPGSDGTIWFALQNSADNGQFVGSITSAGAVKEFTTHGQPLAIVRGPDGNLWFTNYDGTLARMTPSGVTTSFPFIRGGGIESWGITVGPDHNLWIPYETPDPYNFHTFVARVSIAPWA